MKKKILSLLLTLCILITLFPVSAFAGDGGEISVTAQGTCGTGVSWMLEDNGVLTISGEGAMSDFISGKAPWNSYKAEITELVIKDGVTAIGNYAFLGLSALTKATLGADIARIGTDAFSGTTALTRVIGAALENWLAMDVANEQASPCCCGAELYFGENKLESAELSCTQIGAYIFAGCSSLAEVTLADTVSAIGAGAFASCDNLLRVNAPSLEAYTALQLADRASSPCCNGAELYFGEDRFASLTFDFPRINAWAFAGCTSLEFAELGESVSEIGVGAFDGCANLGLVFAPSLEMWLALTLEGKSANPCCNGATLMLGAEILTELELESGTIGDYAFEGCSSLQSLTIGAGASLAGAGAFLNCGLLADAVLEEKDSAIPAQCFEGCYGLEALIISENTREIGARAFADCASLENIDMPAAVGKVYAGAFSGCTGLKAVNIHGLSAWCDIEFEDAYANPTTLAHSLQINEIPITVLVVPDGASIVGNYAFSGCNEIKEIYVPEGVTLIGNGAFAGCSVAEAITLPTTVTTVRSGAFSDCMRLAVVYFAGKAEDRSAMKIYTGNTYLTSATWYVEHVHAQGVDHEEKQECCTSGHSVRYLCENQKGVHEHWYQESLTNPLGHIWSAYTTVPATKTAAGTISRYCQRDGCGEREVIEIPILPILVTFDAQGGTCSKIGTSVIYNEAYGELPEPTLSGFDFAGWYDSRFGGNLVEAETTVTAEGDHKLYARWELSTLYLDTVTDAAFRSVLENYDANSSGNIERKEISGIKELDLSSLGITSLSGVEKLFALEKLYCSGNALTELDVSGNSNLIELDCSNNALKKLVLGDKPFLTSLNCSENKLAVLDLSACAAGMTLDMSDNRNTVSVNGNDKTFSMLDLSPDFDDTRVTGWTSATYLGEGVVKSNVLNRVISYTYELGGSYGTGTFEIEVCSSDAFSVSIDSVRVKPGEEIVVPILLENNPGITSISFKLSYDEAVISFYSIENGALSGWRYDTNTTTFSWTGVENGGAYGGIVKLRFMCAEEDGQSKLEFKNLTVKNALGETITPSVTNAVITVSNLLKGDVTGDGSVTATDLLRLKKHLVNIEVDIDLIAADINGDGVVGAPDLLRLKRYLAGIITAL